jgi:asparagine synthase (glutamine-hydrolysing)
LSRKKAEISTFSIVFSEADYDEGKYARAVAKKFTTDHHELRVSQHDALNTIPEYLCAIDQPTIDGLNTFLVSRATRAAGIKVALSGLGGDELFAGYSNFKTVPQMERFSKFWGQVPGFLRSTVASAYSDLSSVSDQSRKLATMADQEDCAPHPYFLSRMLFTPRQIDFLMPSCDSETKDRAEASMQRNLSETADLDPINRVSYLEMRCYMRNTLLRDSDVMSMAHGLEIRVPLIDHQLAEKLLSLPGAWKTGGKVPKPLLVRALRGELPHEIVYRKKQGFSLPFEHWLREELRAEIEAGLRRVSEGPLAKLLESRAVAEIWEDFLGGRTSWSRPWSLYVLQRWCESHGMMS